MLLLDDLKLSGEISKTRLKMLLFRSFLASLLVEKKSSTNVLNKIPDSNRLSRRAASSSERVDANSSEIFTAR